MLDVKESEASESWISAYRADKMTFGAASMPHESTIKSFENQSKRLC